MLTGDIVFDEDQTQLLMDNMAPAAAAAVAIAAAVAQEINFRVLRIKPLKK
eukprot:SAG25_NODE_11705_length_298_cov_0.371859_1_plen_50_part_01